MLSPEPATPFFAAAQYCARPTTQVARAAKKIVSEIKTNGYITIGGTTTLAIETVVGVLAHGLQSNANHPLHRCLGHDVILVPAPRNAPLKDPAALWPSRVICEELLKHGLGATILALVQRHTAVTKSATASSENRPLTRDHFNSCGINDEAAADFALGTHRRITLVDDVVTRGATLLGSGEHLRRRFPEHAISRFALVRTRWDDQFEDFLDPIEGVVRHYPSGKTFREP